MKYLIKEIFPTIQGEGTQAGTPAVFVRFSGCNLWTGIDRLRNKGKGECALWCDTDFAYGKALELDEIARKIDFYTVSWKEDKPLVVLTGGEPALHLSENKCMLLYMAIPKYKIAIETNGTVSNKGTELVAEFGHTTISPKALRNTNTIDHLKLRKCNDLKIVVPTPLSVEELVKNIEYDTVYFQPMDVGEKGKKYTEMALEYATRFGGKVSIQSHKHVGLR